MTKKKMTRVKESGVKVVEEKLVKSTIQVPPALLKAVPPGWKLRDIQAKALVETFYALERPDVDYVVLEAPPGVGKSLLAVTLARYYRKAALCTLTVQLQEQYVRDFGELGLRVLKGRRNFRCSQARDTCEVGGHIGCDSPACPYISAKTTALSAWLVAANYHSFWHHMPVRLPDGYADEYADSVAVDDWVEGASTQRQLVIFDECFPAGTLVSGRPIESLQVGDLLDSYDIEQGRTVKCRITGTMNSTPKGMVRVSLRDGRTFTCTSNHPVWTEEGWMPAIALQDRSVLHMDLNESSNTWVGVDCVEVLEPGRDGTFGGVCPNGRVYNLEVEGTHTYFAEGVVVHNCHGLEGVVMDMASVVIKLGDLPIPLPPLPTDELSPTPYFAWLEEALPHLKDLAAEYEGTGRHDDLQKLSQLMVKIFGILSSREPPENAAPEWAPTEYIVGRGKNPQTNRLDETWFELKPLHVRHIASRYWRGFPKALFMSATILSAAEFAHALGLDPKRGDFVQISESFPPENRPIIAGQLDMSFKSREESWPMMVKIIEALLNQHATEKGLILPQSREQLKYIMQNLGGRLRTRLIPAFGDDRLEKYNEHLRRRDPSVLIAPGYWEGADLKEASSRFQIIPACPRPQWQGQVKARAQSEPGWYRWLTYTKLVQGLGRSIRSETDTATTYILDREFQTEMNRTGSMIPPWVKAAVKVIGSDE